MTIQQAIQKAIKAGWKPPMNATQFAYHTSPGHMQLISDYHELLDPLFWQSLGKSMGWETEKINLHLEAVLLSHELLSDDTRGNIETSRIIPVWLYHWHRFIDHLASNGTIESFFEAIN